MFDFFQTEIRAYSAAARAASEAYQAGDLKAAQQSQATALIGCATLSRYLAEPLFAESLSEEERRHVTDAIVSLRGSLNQIAKARATRTATAAVEF